MPSFSLTRRLCTGIALIALACSTDSDSRPRTPSQPATAEKACTFPEGSVAVRTPAELEPLCGCTRVEGDVSIDATGAGELACLKALREVTGALAISGGASPQPSALEALSSLRQVRTLSLAGLSVRDLRGLKELRAAERIQISACDQLTDLRGLRADLELRDLWLEKNARLRSLEGFAGLSATAGAEAGPTIRLESLPELEHLDGLFRADGPSIARLQLMGLPKVERVDVRGVRELGALVVRTCVQLREIHGLEAIETTGQLHLTGLPLLERLPAFERLRRAEDLELLELPGVVDLAQLASLESVDRIAFSMMDGLVSLHGLEKVARSQRILLENLSALESLEGLRGLQQVDTLWVGRVEKLESLRGLTLVEAGELVVRYNERLVTLEGLEALRAVGTLDVSENAKLATVRALRGIESAGRVFARYNPTLPACELDWLSMRLPENTTREFGDNGPNGACSP